jgi:hypothetical protein
MYQFVLSCVTYPTWRYERSRGFPRAIARAPKHDLTLPGQYDVLMRITGLLSSSGVHT